MAVLDFCLKSGIIYVTRRTALAVWPQEVKTLSKDLQISQKPSLAGVAAFAFLNDDRNSETADMYRKSHGLTPFRRMCQAAYLSIAVCLSHVPERGKPIIYSTSPHVNKSRPKRAAFCYFLDVSISPCSLSNFLIQSRISISTWLFADRPS